MFLLLPAAGPRGTVVLHIRVTTVPTGPDLGEKSMIPTWLRASASHKSPCRRGQYRTGRRSELKVAIARPER
jgi:hypothetical protein